MLQTELATPNSSIWLCAFRATYLQTVPYFFFYWTGCFVFLWDHKSGRTLRINLICLSLDYIHIFSIQVSIVYRLVEKSRRNSMNVREKSMMDVQNVFYILFLVRQLIIFDYNNFFNIIPKANPIIMVWKKLLQYIVNSVL